MGSLEFSKLLLEKALVAVSPGIGFGPLGEGHVRFALVENDQRIRQATASIGQFLKASRAVSDTSQCATRSAASEHPTLGTTRLDRGRLTMCPVSADCSTRQSLLNLVRHGDVDRLRRIAGLVAAGLVPQLADGHARDLPERWPPP